MNNNYCNKLIKVGKESQDVERIEQQCPCLDFGIKIADNKVRSFQNDSCAILISFTIVVLFNTNQIKKYQNFKRNEDRPRVLLK